MKEIAIDIATHEYHKLKACFQAGKLPLNYGPSKLNQQGIYSCNELRYKKEESLESYLKRFGLSPKHKYALNIFD